MPSAGKIKLDLRTYDDIFSTQEERDEQKKAKIEDIPLDQIDDFPDHPYKVRDDEDMAALEESISKNGIIVPIIVFWNEYGKQVRSGWKHEGWKYSKNGNKRIGFYRKLNGKSRANRT